MLIHQSLQEVLPQNQDGEAKQPAPKGVQVRTGCNVLEQGVFEEVDQCVWRKIGVVEAEELELDYDHMLQWCWMC